MGLKLLNLPNHAGLILAGAIVLIIFALRIAPLLFSRNRPSPHLPPGAPRDYGLLGGGVCSRCHRPQPFGILTFNFGLGQKLTRCQFCGQWSLMRRLSLDALHAAEAAEIVEAQAGQPVSQQSEAEKKQKALDDSRFTDQP